MDISRPLRDMNQLMNEILHEVSDSNQEDAADAEDKELAHDWLKAKDQQLTKLFESIQILLKRVREKQQESGLVTICREVDNIEISLLRLEKLLQLIPHSLFYRLLLSVPF